MHDPLAAVHDVRDSIALAALERIPPYLGQQREALRDWFSKPEGPLSDPLIEFDPPFESADLSWKEVVEAGFIRPETLELLRLGGTIKSTKPYRHQFEAIIAARKGKSIVVSAGTGSGKTECFLIPILDDLVREAIERKQALVGLRSMLVYPLNALVFDQMGRWRAVLRHQQEVLGSVPIRLSMYNAFLQRKKDVGADLRPTFKALGMNENDPDLRPYLPLEHGEVTRREEFLAGGSKGANLLITNYVMLELALLRHVDQRWLDEAKGWKHLVLDEAHTYTGGLAVDIAMLLRRLRDRIGPVAAPQGFATSATFGGKEARTELADFSSVLFNQSTTNIEVLQGRRVEVRPEPAIPKDILPDYSALVAFLRAEQDSERLRPLIFSQSALEGALNWRGQGNEERLRSLLRRCSEEKAPDGARALLPHRLHAVLRRPIPWASQCINPDCPGRSELKGFRRWPDLGWIGQDPSDDVCPKCHGPMLLPVTCGYEGCAQEGLMGMAVYADLFPPVLSALAHPSNPTTEGAESQVLLVQRADWPEERASIPVVLGNGRVTEGSDPNSKWCLVVIGSDREGHLLCPKCEQPDSLENTWSKQFHAGAMDLVALDRLIALQAPDKRAMKEPNEGRRLLTFADSRQGAARLAPRLAFTHRVIFVRRWIVDTLHSIPNVIPALEKCRSQLDSLKKNNAGGLMDDIIRQKEAEFASLQCGETIPGLVREMAKDRQRLERWAKTLEGSRFNQRFQGLGFLPEDQFGKEPDLETIWYGLIHGAEGRNALDGISGGKRGADALIQSLMDFIEGELLLSILRELCRPPGRTPTAVKLGLVRIQWPKLTQPLAPLAANGIPEALHQEVFERACNLMLEQRCVLLPKPFTGQEEDWGKAFMNRRAVLQESSNDRVFSFASDRIALRKFTAFLDLLGERCNGKTDETWNKHVYIALWESLRQVGQNVPLLDFLSVDGVDSLRLNAERIQIKTGNTVFLCSRCGSISPWGGLERCAEQRYRDARGVERSEPCGGVITEIDPSKVQPIEFDAFPHSRQLLIHRSAPEGLTSFEHTAQRSGDQVRRDELLFRQSRMNVLCSSTTLEMGIDLPDLDSVVLMGVPPAASNHTQRVGRAGRTRKRSCLALTLAGDDSFDRWAHRDLRAFLQRPGITPRVDLDRKEKLRQHFFAWRLGVLVRGGDLIKGGSRTELLNKIAEFAGIDPDVRRNAIAEWDLRHPESPWKHEHFAPGWGDEAVLCWESLTDEQWARGKDLFEKDEIVLRVWLKEGRLSLEGQLHRIRKQVLKVEDAISHGQEQQAKFMKLLLFSLRKYDALNWLAENHLLPRFGFPVSSVSLSPPKPLESMGRIDRDRRQAVMEWTPGATVVVANHRWTVKGLAPDVKRGQSETHHRLFTMLVCRACGHQHVSPSADLGNCPACGSGERDLRAIVIPAAFASEDLYKLAGTDSDLPASRGSRVLTLDDRQWPAGLISFRPSVPVAFLNLGEQEKGFWLCSGCGRLRRSLGRKQWKPCCPKDTSTEPDAVVMGDVVRMDVMRISPRTNSSYEGMRAASQAFRLAAAFLLELDPRSLALADILEDGLNTIYLVDLTDGGSGLLERLQEPARCRAWLALARRILSHEHRPSEACANACPECLLTHDNRAEHRHRPFRRLEGIATVDSLLSDLEGGGESRRAGAEPSAEKDTDGSWEEVEGLTCLSLSVIHALREGGAPVPEVGRDLLFEDVIVANAEICWMKQRVAVLTQEGELRPIPEWTLLAATDPRLAENALAALLC